MKRFHPEEIQALAARLAASSGVRPGDAQVFAQALVDADLHGISTHGVSRLNIYLKRIQLGLIAADAELKTLRNGGSILSLDAGNGLGQVQALRALELLFPLARQNGIAAATICNSQHFGVLSYYCNMAADRGMILLAMTASEPAMSPAGGYEPFFGTNPLAASFPTGKGYNVKVDLATSIVARGNIVAAQKQGKAIPEGWALDRHGEPTTDAQEALVGTVLTMAGHKGYALALMVEILSSVLSGAAIGSGIGSMYKDLDRKQDVGHFFCLLNIEAFLDLGEFKQRLDDTIDRIKGSKRRPGVEEIRIPGERSEREAAANRARGIAIADVTLAELHDCCERLGVPFDLSEVKA